MNFKECCERLQYICNKYTFQSNLEANEGNQLVSCLKKPKKKCVKSSVFLACDDKEKVKKSGKSRKFNIESVAGAVNKGQSKVQTELEVTRKKVQMKPSEDDLLSLKPNKPLTDCAIDSYLRIVYAKCETGISVTLLLTTLAIVNVKERLKDNLKCYWETNSDYLNYTQIIIPVHISSNQHLSLIHI